MKWAFCAPPKKFMAVKWGSPAKVPPIIRPLVVKFVEFANCWLRTRMLTAGAGAEIAVEVLPDGLSGFALKLTETGPCVGAAAAVLPLPANISEDDCADATPLTAAKPTIKAEMVVKGRTKDLGRP